MKRVEVMEFEDQPWFPSWLRTCMTNNIVIMARLLGVGHALSELISKALRKSSTTQIVDLGSGAGGVLPEIVPKLQEQMGSDDIQLVLSDKFPNADAIRKFNGSFDQSVRYCEESVDATQLETAPAGLKTMVNCFHHMSPENARTILSSAATRREPLLIYEMAGHQTMPFIAWLLGLPLGLPIVFVFALVKSALVRPVTFRQIFFTYVIPLIPLFYAWDGQASMPRMYRLEDLDELLEGLEQPRYQWEKGYGTNQKGAKLGTYLLGVPVDEK